MARLTKSQVRDILEPFHPELLSIVHNAWKDWKSCPPHMSYARTRANVVWDCMITHARITFEDTPGVHFIERPNSCYLYFEPGLVVRFKKADENNRSKNFPTNLALDFNDPQINLPAVPTATRVEVVYQLNREESGIASVRVVQRNHSNVAWVYKIEQATTAEIHQLPPQSKAKSSTKTKTKTKVAAKKDSAKSDVSAGDSSG